MTPPMTPIPTPEPSLAPIPGRKNRWIWVLMGFILLGNVACAFHTIFLTAQQNILKVEQSHVNSARNGLFSVDVWMGHFQEIVGRSITKLKFSPEEERELRKEIGEVVRALIIQADEVMRQDQSTLKGKVRKVAYKMIIDVPALTEEAPAFAQIVLDEIQKPENLAKLKKLALGQLSRYALQSKDLSGSGDQLKAMLEKYQTADSETFNAKLSAMIKDQQKRIHLNIGIMLASLILVLGIWFGARKHPQLHRGLFCSSVVLAVIILASSLSLPMIDIDARITNLDFMLMGEHIRFNDQVLFYRSKSIFQVVKSLMLSGKADSLFVGILLITFSVLFPAIKLISSLIVVMGARIKNNVLIHFFAFNSGKWAMADVLVVAIFMSYIGFNAILNDQLKDLQLTGESLQFLSTNQTALQSGFLMFVAFVLFSLFLSEILKRITTPSR